MEGTNLWCEAERCGSPAIAFGMKGDEKSRRCKSHMYQLIEKKMQIVDIAGYGFITSLEDAALFAKRESVVQKGRGNLEMLETNCQLELTAAIAAIEKAKSKLLRDVESRFEEMKVAVANTCAETRRQLSQLRTDLEQFLISKENQLSPSVLLVCSDLNVALRLLRFGLADASDRVSAVLRDSWTVAKPDIHSALKSLDSSQRNAAVNDTLAEAVEHAKKGLLEALQYADSIIGDETSFEEGKVEVLLEICAQNKTQITQNVKWLQHSWNLRHQCAVWNLATVEVGKQLAGTFYHQFGLFHEAEGILRYCYDIASEQSSVSELSMLLSNEICGVYFTTEKYQEAESLGLWILGIFGEAKLPSEHYWTTLFYLSSSMRELSKDNEAKALVEKWRMLDTPEESKLGEMMRLLTCGIGASAESERCLLRAKRIGMSYFPTSPFTALTLFHLGLLTKANARGEQYFLQAQSIYEVASPKSAQAAMNLSKLGDFNKAARRLNEAENYYQLAQPIYESTNSKSYNAAVNLIELGDLFSYLNRLDEAEICYQLVKSIIEVVGPEQRPRLQNASIKLAALRFRSAQPSVAQEERKELAATIRPRVQPAAPKDSLLISRQARTQGILFRLALDSNNKMDGRLQVFDINSKTWAPPQSPTLQMEIDYGTCYAFATETAVVLCGSKLHLGHNKRARQAARTNVYRVEFARSPPAVTALPNFSERRVLPGLYVHGEVLFVFGGKDALSLSLSAPQKWQGISGKMSEKKVATTPCRLELKLYICQRRIDVFNLQSFAFEMPFAFQLPEENYLSRVAFFSNNELVVISSRYTFRIDITQPRMTQEEHELEAINPTSPVVIKGDSAFWVSLAKCKTSTIKALFELSYFI